MRQKPTTDPPLDPETKSGPPLDPETKSDLWRFYEEHAAQARQHETLRAAVATLLTGFAAIIVASAVSDGFKRADIFDGVVIVLTGVVGALLTLKHYERNRFHTNVLKKTRDKIEQGREGQAFDDQREEPESRTFLLLRQHATDDEGLHVPIPAFLLWLLLPIVIVAAGAVIIG